MLNLFTKLLRKAGLSQPKTLRAFVTDNQLGYTHRATFVYDPERNVWRSKTASCWHLQLRQNDVNRLFEGDVTLHFHDGLYSVSSKDMQYMFWRTRL